jgi:MATE family multidrug resistance protein
MKNSESNYRSVLTVSLPLVLSMAATTVMEFTDRVFLANYSLDAIAAALPAGITAFLFLTFFSGISAYMNVFIAQYKGADAEKRIGACLWQAIYFSTLSAGLLLALSLAAEPIFRLGGHPPAVQNLEVIYFRTLCLGGGLNVLGAGLGTFFSGRGRTRPVMFVSFIGMLLNIPLDYALIYGWWIFPELGILGAALATVFSWLLIVILYGVLIFDRHNISRFNLAGSRKLDRDLMGRLIKFGLPGSLQFTLDVFAFTFFVFMVGRLGAAELAINNIVLSIESIAFMPALGFSIGLSTLAGQALGRNDVNQAIKVTRQTIHILGGYILILDLVMIVAPHWILGLFLDADTSEHFSLGINLIRIMSLYIIFDGLYMVYIGLLKGAGDTRFIMVAIGAVSLLFLVIPIYVAVTFMAANLVICWWILTGFVISLCAAAGFRYRQGRWKSIRVIEI